MSNRAKRNTANKGRNQAAVSAWNRTGAGPMKDRRAERGGARNAFLDLLDQVHEEQFQERKEEQERIDEADMALYLAMISDELQQHDAVASEDEEYEDYLYFGR